MKCPGKLRLSMQKENCCPQLCVLKADFNAKEEVKSHNMFEILAHQVPINEPSTKIKSKSIKKPLTTYINDFCRRKIPHLEMTFHHSSYPGYHIPGQEFSGKTTHKGDYKKFSEKEILECQNKIDSKKCNLSCPKTKFEGVSETKSKFKFLKPGQKFFAETSIPPPTNIIRKKKRPPFTKTTHSSQFKPPVDYSKLTPIIQKPKPEIQVSSEPFKGLSLYQKDFRNHSKRKRQLPCKPREIHLTEIPVMENKTTYKTSFQYKGPIQKEVTKWNPNHRIYKSANPRNRHQVGENYPMRVSCGAGFY